MCSSNLRQIGLGCVLYADNTGSLPDSFYGLPGQSKGEMMALYRGKEADNSYDDWEGLGWLWAWNYLSSPEVFYCPSHHGEHFFDRYEQQFLRPDVNKVYGNYHYSGDRDWESGLSRRIGARRSFVLATDGMRTYRDLNHSGGMNVLRNDNSVDWRDDIFSQVSARLPTGAGQSDDDDEDDSETYTEIWDIINDTY